MMISEQAIYKKVPPARLLKMISKSGLSPSEIFQPTKIPIGVKVANKIIIAITVFLPCGPKVFCMDIPSDIPAAPLWRKIASAITAVYYVVLFRPRDKPSNKEWIPRPIIRINGVILSRQLAHPVFLMSFFYLESVV